MYQKALTIVLVFVALLSIGTGITGFYTLDTTSGICLDDGDCVYSVCCAVYGQSYGVCGQESECDEIYLQSKDNNVLQAAPSLEEEVSQDYIAVAVGLILLLIIAVVSYAEWNHEKAPKKKKVKKKRSKKR